MATPDFSKAIAQAATDTPQAVEQVPMVPGLSLHIDGDFLAYNAAGNDDTVPGQARLNCLGVIDIFKWACGAETVVVHNTLPGSHKGHRYLVAQVKPYQGHRTSGRKPKNHGYLQDFLLGYTGSAFTSKTWVTREADDGMAACAHHAIGKAPGYAAIATKDKDMRMFPGVHVNWDTLALTRVNPGDFEVIGEDGKVYGLKWFWLQMLMGDTADNCPGLEYYIKPNGTQGKLGEKTAEALIAGCTSTDEACTVVMDLYQAAYGPTWADRFVEQAALMWMRCAVVSDIDDFLTHAGHSKISTPFPEEVVDATFRMKERVTLAWQSLN